MNYLEAKATFFLKRNWKTSYTKLIWCTVVVMCKSILSIRLTWNFKSIFTKEISDLCTKAHYGE